MEDFVLLGHRIKLMFNKPKNNGFYVTTFVEFSQRNTQRIIDDYFTQQIFYPNVMNDTAFHHEFITDERNWMNLKQVVVYE